MTRMILAAFAVMAVTASSAQAYEPAESVPFWAAHGCSAGHPSKQGYRTTTRLLKNHRPLTAKTKRAVKRAWRCTMTRAKARAIIKHVAALRRWRESYEHRWPITFNRLPAGDQAWAVSTSSCESGMNPATNTGNGFYGAFQFMLSTWHSAGGTGYPNQHSWHYQAVIAVGWMHVAGAGQWPVCGH